MKKYMIRFAANAVLFVVLVVVMLCVPFIARAEGVVASEGYDWQMLGTVAGAAAFTLLFVQYIKAPLDKVWKMPTRFVAYLVAFIVMLGARAFTVGMTMEGVA